MLSLWIELNIFLGIPVYCILFYYGLKHKPNNIFLALSILTIWYALVMGFLNSSGLILKFPIFIRTGNIAAYLILPFSYIYTRNSFYPGISWRKRDFLLLLPCLFYCVDMLPFFFSPPDYKVRIMAENLNDTNRLFKGMDGWIHIHGLHFVLRYIWASIIMVLQLRLIRRNWNFEGALHNYRNSHLFWFIVTLTLLYVPLIFPGIFGVLFHLSWYTMDFVNVSLSLTLFATLCFLLFSPRILYGFQIDTEKEIDEALPESGITDTVFSGKSGQLHDYSELKNQVEAFIQEKKPYLKEGYTIHELARDMGYPVYQISPMINQSYGVHFNSWLNRYRIEHFIKTVENGEFMNLTFDAIARKSGFSSRVTFINAFKKEKGLTPGAYFKNSPK